jgi:hypothetical protein
MKEFDEKYFVQVRMNIRLRDQLQKLSRQHEMSVTDIVRVSLDIGVRAFEKILEAQDILIKEYLQLLKSSGSRKKREKRSTNTDNPALP